MSVKSAAIIHVLPENIANKIAAGEVIERPASIVKELIENALDAGATSIDVEIQHGGKSLIRVADNGHGMAREDVELAFKRHATSKIQDIHDLDSITSYGFRGEALPSIAAVSRTTLQTRAKGADTGTQILFDGGKLTSAKEIPCREGTIVEVRDLFFNTPARRKFLRTDPTELGHVSDVVSNMALSMPHVQFTLKSSTKTILNLLKTDRLITRATAIYGDDHAKHLIEIEDEGSDVKVWGVIGKPFVARGNRSGQILFVNRRLIKSTSLSYAIHDGFHGLLMHGQFAVAVLFIDVDPQKVDVNVHPTKQEVRLSNEREVRSLIKRAVTTALQKEGDLAPDLNPAPSAARDMPFGRTPKYNPYAKDDQMPPVKMEDLGLAPNEASHIAEPPSFPKAQPTEDLGEPISIRDQLRITKILGQIHHTFIVAETDEGLMIIDQHAAHEKVMYESLLAEFKSGNPKKQGLLLEEIIEIPARQHQIFKESQPLLEKLGFEIDEFGENSIVIRSFPAVLKDVDPVSCVKRFLEQKEAGKMKTDLENAQEEVAALIACKRKSVKAHDVMTGHAMEVLLKELGKCENPFSCPHGRPSFFKYTFDDLEKQFKRK